MSAVPGAILPANWPAPAGVHAFTTLRHGAGVSAPPFDSFNLGARCGDDSEAVRANRAELQRRGLPAAPHWLQQVHGTGVIRFDAASLPGQGDEPEADAAVTASAGTVLAILTADCLSVVFAAKDGREVAAAHAGWRGLAGGVLERTLEAMHAPATQVLAWLGPAAGPQAYEIGAEVRDAFLAEDASAGTAFVPTRPGHWTVDLYALARIRLRRAGMADADIHGGGLCTISDPQRFYSHRRDARTGRMATLVWIDP
ncbi:multi-copper polyphenol oxidoreductase [Pseudoxanthomonas kalamensis DSM 18571]|uniref:peptidoglycan editing factor PgeF n=1 Tax=Pseudoxanthomonas kalamensis TaxID=289483 RepID=UPI0013909ED3|nr:peptidoglycan editing factor PgeF [Pseudoxanthomonas kalamensis]KAF1708819.1 multi-copper polyphenol oxidoreductase [Pseudoxanthomonas kalamensis DSM 18571]